MFGGDVDPEQYVYYNKFEAVGVDGRMVCYREECDLLFSDDWQAKWDADLRLYITANKRRRDIEEALPQGVYGGTFDVAVFIKNGNKNGCRFQDYEIAEKRAFERNSAPFDN